MSIDSRLNDIDDCLYRVEVRALVIQDEKFCLLKKIQMTGGPSLAAESTDKKSLSRARKAFNEPRWMAGNALRTYVTFVAICCLCTALYMQL